MSKHDQALDDKTAIEAAGIGTAISPNGHEEEVDERMAGNQAAIELLESWLLGDEDEQRETLEYLKKVLDEDRLSDRKLFT